MNVETIPKINILGRSKLDSVAILREMPEIIAAESHSGYDDGAFKKSGLLFMIPTAHFQKKTQRSLSRLTTIHTRIMVGPDILQPIPKRKYWKKQKKAFSETLKKTSMQLRR